MKTNTLKSQHRQEAAKVLKQMYRLWGRWNNARKKSEQINLPDYFESKYQSIIRGYPGQASKGLMARFETLLVNAGHLPEGPLIATDILRFIVEIDHRYKISDRYKKQRESERLALQGP
jgi:hypothetical protein